MRIESYWHDDKNAPYATFLSIVEAQCHPEAYDEAYDNLKSLAKRTDDPEMDTFKREFREVIADPSVLPQYALDTAAEYDDGSDAEFLARLWRDLYPDEPYPSAAGGTT